MATTTDLALTGLNKLDWAELGQKLDTDGFFADPLPPLVQALRTQLYPPIARVANTWAERLDERTYPDKLDGLLAECAAEGQTRPTPLVLHVLGVIFHNAR